MRTKRANRRSLITRNFGCWKVKKLSNCHWYIFFSSKYSNFILMEANLVQTVYFNWVILSFCSFNHFLHNSFYNPSGFKLVLSEYKACKMTTLTTPWPNIISVDRFRILFCRFSTWATTGGIWRITTTTIRTSIRTTKKRPRWENR